MRRLVELGIITRPHGFKGDFVVQSHGGIDSALGYVNKLYVGPSETQVSAYQVLEAAWMPRGWKVRLAGVDSVEVIETWRNYSCFAARDELKPTQENEYYLTDLEDSEVWDWTSQKLIGRFVGAEDALRRSGGSDRWWLNVNGETIAVPATKSFIVKVDPINKRIFVQNLADLT